MVAVNNNLTDITKIFDKKSNPGQSDEIFAELFAILNSDFSKEMDSNISKVIKNDMATPLENLSLNSKNIEKKDGTIDLKANKSEIDLAKDLIQVFYKDFGIDISNQKIAEGNSIPKPSISSKNMNLPTLKLNEVVTGKGNLNSSSTEENIILDRKPDLSIKIVKIEKTSEKTERLKLNLIGESYGKTSKAEKSEKVLSVNDDSHLKQVRTDNTSKLIDKKEKKKTKQIQQYQKKDIVDENTKNLNNMREIDKTISNVKNAPKKNVENSFIQKKSENNKLQQNSDISKKPVLNTNNQEYLDLMESSWGEKFSKIIKNAVNNGIKSLELQLKPKNLGKLNLEVTLKNNNTHINISSENQDVVNILNENLAKINDIVEKEAKSFSSFMNNQNNQDNFSGNRENKEKNYSDKLLPKKSNKIERHLDKLSNHNIDVNA